MGLGFGLPRRLSVSEQAFPTSGHPASGPELARRLFASVTHRQALCDTEAQQPSSSKILAPRVVPSVTQMLSTRHGALLCARVRPARDGGGAACTACALTGGRQAPRAAGACGGGGRGGGAGVGCLLRALVWAQGGAARRGAAWRGAARGEREGEGGRNECIWEGLAGARPQQRRGCGGKRTAFFSAFSRGTLLLCSAGAARRAQGSV